ncbi:MAG: hypothetical protein LBI04_06295 [Treponema sp.]|jgi:hypothetical protein|nr:hypothetical protein [Treponema sp.]
MKKILFAALLLSGALIFAETPIPFFGGSNLTIDVDTTFSTNVENRSTGLLTDVGIGLWFEYVPYQDRNITPQQDVLSVSLKLANSAFYAWRGYNLNPPAMYDGDQTPSDIQGDGDQATSIWFDTFIAQLEYNQWWVRISGIEPELTLSQASIRSALDPIMGNRTDISKNRIPLPLFYVPGNAVGGSWSHGSPGITSLINRDIVHLDRREVEIAGNLSAGMKGEIFDFLVKAGSWKSAEENVDNSWVAGADINWRPDLASSIKFSFLTAIHYGTVTRRGGVANQEEVPDPISNPEALIENPLAFGLGYEYRINLPGRMVIKPYAGVDFIYETQGGEYSYEIGGGIQWFFRGSGAQYKRNDKIGGVQLGDCDLPVAFIAGMNVDKNGFCNAIFSLNEDPRSSLIPNLGGWFQFELMNITGKEYKAPDGKNYDDFMFGGIAQIEYLVTNRIMPYVFAKVVPANTKLITALNIAPVYDKDYTSLNSKVGCRLTPFDFFSIDLWYEKTDIRFKDEWTMDQGTISVNFGIKNYF